MGVNPESKARSDELDAIAERNRKYSETVADDRAGERKQKILQYFRASENDWNNYRWQMRKRVSDVNTLHGIFPLAPERFAEIEAVSQKYRWAISPYYLSLMDVDDRLDPVGLMAVPSILELAEQGETDPMDEEHTHPAPLVTRRYPDRLIVNATNSCGMFCRFCQRKRNIKETDRANKKGLEKALDFIRNNRNIRDVLITGGDPLTLPNEYLDTLLGNVRQIEHVEMMRIGTRIPVTVPQRIDSDLLAILRKYPPLYMSVHFNHPREITPDSMAACARLADAGIPLGNQMVLLNGVNNDKGVVLSLNKKLLQCRVRPYYIFFAKNVKGATHFNCSLAEGLDILDFLRGNVSGLAVPTFIVNAPNGFGKVPILRKNYAVEGDTVELTTWERRKIRFKNPARKTITELYECASSCV